MLYILYHLYRVQNRGKCVVSRTSTEKNACNECVDQTPKCVLFSLGAVKCVVWETRLYSTFIKNTYFKVEKCVDPLTKNCKYGTI